MQEGKLPFTEVLTPETISQSLTAAGVVWNERIYTPLVTLWVFLSQVLSQDHSCRAAVAKLIAHRRTHGQRGCSADTGAYCQARKRLPEKFFADVACQVGRALDSQANSNWLWKGQQVYMFDGTTVTMADTLENQAAYPQIRTIMAQAATEHDIPPRTISFKGAIQTLEAFQPAIASPDHCHVEERQSLYEHLLQCVASHRVGNRPGRFEPRKVKRRIQLFDYLRKPRSEAKLDCVKGVKEN